MTIRDELIEAVNQVEPMTEVWPKEEIVDAALDALIQRVPSVCPSGFDWTAGDIEDWLRAVKEGRA